MLATIRLYNPAHDIAQMAKKRAGPMQMRSTMKNAKTGPGRPQVHQETWSKVSVVLFDRQIVHLDRLAVNIRGKDARGKKAKTLNRAEIIRALIDGLLDSGMDLTGSASEADVRARVTRRLGGAYR